MESVKVNKKVNKTPWLDPYKFKSGAEWKGNAKGRPLGKSLKTFVKEYFESLPDEQKIKFLNKIDPEMAWKMAEGNPATQTDVTSKGEKIMYLPSTLMEKNGISSNTGQSSEEQEKI